MSVSVPLGAVANGVGSGGRERAGGDIELCEGEGRPEVTGGVEERGSLPDFSCPSERHPRRLPTDSAMVSD